MAIGRQDVAVRTIEGAPRWGPQSFTRGLLRGDVLAWTHDERAAELSVIPKRTHTYFGPYKPGTAQRIPPLVNTGYGRDYATAERVRTALVARAQMFKSALRLGSSQPPAEADASQAVPGTDAAQSQAALVGRT